MENSEKTIALPWALKDSNTRVQENVDESEEEVESEEESLELAIRQHRTLKSLGLDINQIIEVDKNTFFKFIL